MLQLIYRTNHFWLELVIAAKFTEYFIFIVTDVGPERTRPALNVALAMLTGAPNDGFLLIRTLKTVFKLSMGYC